MTAAHHGEFPLYLEGTWHILFMLRVSPQPGATLEMTGAFSAGSQELPALSLPLVQFFLAATFEGLSQKLTLR